MQKDEFYKYVEHPELLDKESVSLLTDLVNAFPYFQTARLLLTKALHEQKNFYFDSQLKVTASYFSDRNRLHEFINNGALGEKMEEERVEIVPVLDNKTEEETMQEEVVEVLENNTPIYKESEAVVVLENIADAVLDAEKEAEIVVAEAPKYTFLGWLKEVNNGGNIPKKKEIEGAEVEKEEIFEGNKKGVQEGIIENFMKTNPVIPPPKKEFYSPVNMAKLSIIENDDLCSETLAKIYFDQGNYGRAKSMFERLSLKYPQKSVYFAARIKEINDLINK